MMGSYGGVLSVYGGLLWWALSVYGGLLWWDIECLWWAPMVGY